MLPAELYEVVQLLAAALIQVPACMPISALDRHMNSRAYSCSSGAAGTGQRQMKVAAEE